ncbi:TolC family protein [Synoicihabitans lomoniglobus]|uniref:TolC family protein n=1 Tax=Synoicihabitans lomoniglobus TaxID=2909285 RepID=A0AAF0I3H3_9BACT|nr:TolC family protein [Opitutaceae bacterium LMO-M01]WED66134.1 TolC family protein [Opitutaceae bacterium LMO-M01]
MSRLIRPVALALTLATVSFAQDTAPASLPVLTLEEVVAQALDQNFSLEIQRFSSETAAAAVDVADADYDPRFQVTASTGVTQQAQPSSTLDGVTSVGPRSDTGNIRAGVSQKIVTGATVEAGANLRRSKSNSRNALLNPAYNSDVSLSVSQPLLRGFGKSINQAAIARARLGVERADLDFKSAVLDVVRNVEAAYFNLAFARQQLAVREFSLNVAQELLNENEAKRETGVATDLDVLQAQVGVANANRNVLLAQQTVSDREDALKALISRFELDQPLGPIELGEISVPSVSFDRSYQLARTNRPDYASTALSVEQLRLDERTAKNSRKATLDLGADVGLNSIDGNAGDSTSNVWNGDGYSWQVDLQLIVPWGFRAEKARHAQAVAALGREETRLVQLEQSIMVDVRAAIRSVQTNAESLRISQLATQLSQDQFDLEKARFDAGLSTFRRVQEAQEDLDTARVNELQAAVALRVAQADLARLEGSSLARYSIELE